MGKGAQRDWKAGEVGILTFHCSDNFGAMLQAYALKRRLRAEGAAADIVRYEPPFLTGRHWLIPYLPAEGPRGWLRSAAYAVSGMLRNLRSIRSFTARRSSMRRFRMEYLVDRNQPRILFLPGLKKLSYRCYVVGSDQIWNPDITFGLRRAYFGDFEARNKERTVAYAASLGGGALPVRYERRFAELVRRLDAVSVREAGAVSCVRRFFPGTVTAVTDPVFFLKKQEWKKAERLPGRENYILVCVTETNRAMAEYVHGLSRETGLSVLELRAGMAESGGRFPADAAAGPAEFLGYVDCARYVVTNSFHAAAFSVLYEKQFLVFAHSRVNERIVSLLALCGLEERLCREEGGDITAPVDWPAVRARTAAAADRSLAFLCSSIAGRPE